MILVHGLTDARRSSKGVVQEQWNVIVMFSAREKETLWCVCAYVHPQRYVFICIYGLLNNTVSNSDIQHRERERSYF
jgi:hypothetical protein